MAGAHEGHGAASGATGDSASPQHVQLPQVFGVTRPQLLSVTLLTLVALAAGVIYAALKVNLSISADEVRGAVMPPGMIMTRDTPADAMRDMSAVDPGEIA